MVLVSQVLRKVCRIGFAVLVSFPIAVNGENLSDIRISSNLQLSESNFKLSANKIDFASIFQEFGVTGSILIYDASKNQLYQHNAPRNSKAFLPASTPGWW